MKTTSLRTLNEIIIQLSVSNSNLNYFHVGHLRVLSVAFQPFVSGAALRLEGQLTVYNYKGGPCYRCLIPTPPPTTACQQCSDRGVIGVGKANIQSTTLLVTSSSYRGIISWYFLFYAT